MKIPDAQLDDFIGRWEKAFGEKLTRDDANQHATRLLALYRLLLRPIPGLTQPSAPLIKALPKLLDVGKDVFVSWVVEDHAGGA